LIYLAAAFLLPLVPAAVLYGLFNSQNSAVYDKEGLKLGGPAALYFALLLLSLRYVNKWRTVADPLEKLKRLLVGAWDIESVSAGSQRAAASIATFAIQDDELRLSGGPITEQGVTIGRWSPDRLILDREHDGVIYLYELRDVNRNDTWRGLMEVTLVRTETALCMKGTWEVIGPVYHRGTVTFTKRSSTH
jgi:hypothetical protein